MRQDRAKAVRRELEDRGTTLSGIGRDLRVTRQHVSHVLRGRSVSRRVKLAITDALGWDPWSDADWEARP